MCATGTWPGGYNATATLAHEMKHGFQYETHEADLRYDGTGSGPLTDLNDELAAFKREQLFGGNTSVNFTIGLLKSMYKHDADGPVNVSTLYNGQTYGDAINDQLFERGRLGLNPVIIINGWQTSYIGGVLATSLLLSR